MRDWANNLKGPVALHLRERLLPVEGQDAVVFPPTYAFDDKHGIPYQLDELSDGTKVAQLDSVGSQANRMEPLFRAASAGRSENQLAALVPQVTIVLDKERSVSILDAGHRLGDAICRASELHERVENAFADWKDRGDATAIAKLAPTSLVFGVWDSRGAQAKVPRIVQSVIRAWDVDALTRSAQYNPPVDYAALDVFSDEEKAKEEGNTKSPLAQQGFVHVPAVGTHGGIVVRGGIFRDVTINLVALRQLDGENGDILREYVLGLALVAATEPTDGYLRQGCLLTLDPDNPSVWNEVDRSGKRTPVDFGGDVVLSFAKGTAARFGVGESGSFAFRKERAKGDVAAAKKKAKSK
ncbi:MAG: type I-U CRISPR-associated protein Cas7 [Acidobacteria bacterium RIFCSPLOWO2_02_FULL_67_36]|nr:MAG: type I-U CRISPR-associated protein Cas7 [Acidobacteria bacterium RIFCSPLOWO2_02_FULL_67_36]OFW19034.1 MAG: type I-U CRISPR-associated protein Cas7 [Acidobacteria bacterium RIFCSPLOWO2_12_FULL_66_21]